MVIVNISAVGKQQGNTVNEMRSKSPKSFNTRPKSLVLKSTPSDNLNNKVLNIPILDPRNLIFAIKKKRNESQKSNLSIKDFVDLGDLGKGSYGIVQHVKSKIDGKEYALKIISNESLADDKEMIKNEVELIKDIDSQFVVKVFGSFSDKMNHYIMLEYISASDLDNYIYKSKKTNNLLKKYPKVRKKFFAGVLKGLQAIHKKGLIYRDLKARNVMVSEKAL
ncbi:protein kinase [Candidatus Margulisiibacteriota bacterium]